MIKFDHILQFKITLKDIRPPEDCGGPGGYYRLLEVLANPDHEDHELLLAWTGGDFDPNAFDAKGVRFDDPEQRWSRPFQSQ